MRLLILKYILSFLKKEKKSNPILSKKELEKIKLKQYRSEYYKKNKVKILANRRSESNKIRIQNYQKEYYKNTREYRLAYQNEYRKNNQNTMQKNLITRTKAWIIKNAKN